MMVPKILIQILMHNFEKCLTNVNRVFFSNDCGLERIRYFHIFVVSSKYYVLFHFFLLHHLFELQFEITSGAIVGSSLLAAGLEKQGNNSHLDPLTKLDYIFLLSG